jgi:hypothetical protein
MINVKRLGSILSLVWIATAMGYPRGTVSEYVAPSEAAPKR